MGQGGCSEQASNPVLIVIPLDRSLRGKRFHLDAIPERIGERVSNGLSEEVSEEVQKGLGTLKEGKGAGRGGRDTHTKQLDALGTN